MVETMHNILLVDDDFVFKMDLERSLASMGYHVVGLAESGEESVQMARDLHPDLILMDIVMPGSMDGISAAEKIRQESDVAIVFITGHSDPQTIERAKRVEPFGYIMKPFSEAAIRSIVEIAFYRKEMERKLKKGNGGQEKKSEKGIRIEPESGKFLTQLLNAQKMEAIGTLTGGIAHDYNNLLTIIIGNLCMAQEETEAHSVMAKLLRRVEEASYKAKDLTHQLMIFSQSWRPNKEQGPIEGLLRETPEQVPTHVGISYRFSIQDDLWPVAYDAKQMRYAISNILINAVESMSEGGTIAIQAENRIIQNKGNHSALLLGEGNYVRIAIQDEGRGIPEEHMIKIFDPYFSTKERGVQKGMGLGLATAYTIIQKHGGHITVDSTVGVGTTVNIFLPALEREVRNVQREGAGHQPAIAGQQAGMRRILVMDDEESLRALSGEMLEMLGYESNAVKDGTEAIHIYKESMHSGRPFDAVILDLTIKGGMGGDRIIQELLRIDPNVKAIVCSGYFNNPVLARYEEYGFRGALPKPYQKTDLERVLREVLD